MTSAARASLAFAPLALGLGALLASGALAARVPEAELTLWRLLALQLCWVGVATAAAHVLGGSLRARLGLDRGRFGWGALAAGAVGLLALSGALEFAIAAYGLRNQGALARLDELVEAAAPRSPLLVFVATALAPGIGEEILFRGLLQRALERRFDAWAIPLAALAFGLLHQDRIHSPAAFALGCYLGTLAYLSGSTLTAVFCHVANNSAATLPELLGAALPAPADGGQAWLWAAFSLACLGALAVRGRERSAPEAPSG